ncbi:MAG: large repetitive protein [Acidimicrobiaceae bacterium]|nr:large repetitive protein [Acidimicrobiaceae bacterium]
MRISLKSRRLKAVSAGAWLALIGFVVVALLPFAAPAAGAADSTTLLTWDKVTPTPAPPPRLHPAMALDPATGTTVLFGGRAGSQVLADTWTWDGSGWTAQHPATSPPALEWASMAYDNIGNRILLFGGIGSDGNATSATWSWDGSTWAALAPASVPPPRYAASIASEGVSQGDVLFGGLSGGSSLGDTWSWDGTNWVPNAPAASPAARSGAAMTYDSVRGAVVLFGGATGSDNRADTWTWDRTNWTQQHPASSPPARNDAALGFDDVTQSAILFGGSGGTSGTSGPTALGDTWVWNGSTWSTSLALSILPTLSPPARIGAALATGPTNHRLVLFGGQSGGSAGAALGDTWSVATLATVPSQPTSSTVAGAAAGSTTTPGATSSTTAVGGRAETPTTAGKSIPTPTAKAAPPAPLAVASPSARRGQSVRISGSGFRPGAKITITFHSVSVVLGTTIADAQGRFSATVLVPTDAPPGEHHIEANGASTSGEPAVLVGQVSIMAPGGHHSWVLPAFMVALTVLLAAGAGVVLATSARWQRPSART